MGALGMSKLLRVMSVSALLIFGAGCSDGDEIDLGTNPPVTFTLEGTWNSVQVSGSSSFPVLVWEGQPSGGLVRQIRIKSASIIFLANKAYTIRVVHSDNIGGVPQPDFVWEDVGTWEQESDQVTFTSTLTEDQVLAATKLTTGTPTLQMEINSTGQGVNLLHLFVK